MARRVKRDGEDGGDHPRWPPLGGEGGGGGGLAATRILVRVGACAEELRLIGVAREEVRASLGSADGGWDSDTRYFSMARAPHLMERMWDDPCGEG